MSAITIDFTLDQLEVFKATTPGLISIKNREYEAHTSIGLRPTQEDRLVLIPRFFCDEISFCGVFDGTVGHDASEFISQNITQHLWNTPELRELAASSATLDDESEDVAAKIRAALRAAFLSADAALIEMCAEKNLHYASSTGVSALLYKNLLSVAHIGDSKACIAKMRGGELQPEWLTIDHKPNMTHELKRIEESGGSLVWLHGNKPYIRGGDFFKRQANGEHPKQLNYSRAFGGKDLKMFGLSAEPDVNHFVVSAEDHLVLIGSDGLWDVLNPKTACELALLARSQGRSATAEIVQKAIQMMPSCGVSDNVTAIAIFLR